MITNTDKIRMAVFRIWFFTLGVIVLMFAEKILGLRNLSPPFASMLQSFQMMAGLVVPQIGTMAAFYFNLDRQAGKLDSLSKDQVTVITYLSVGYHVLFISCVIAGIGFYAFDRTADGNALERNTSAVVAIMGLFSVFLMPIAFLFSKPKEVPPE